MKYQESPVKVYHTTDYTMFNRIRGNRDLNGLKIKKITHDIKNGVDLLCDFPILVTETTGPLGKNRLDVLDGQHRLEAARVTKKPVYFIVRKAEMDLHGVARLNSLQEKWKPADFINCYIERGVKDYQRLRDFVEQYGTPISMAIILLEKGVVHDAGIKDNLKEAFMKGEFRVKHWKQAVDIIENCKLFGASEAWNTTAFVKAITKILKANTCDFDELLEKFNQDPKQLGQAKNYKGYCEALERIYNKGYSKRRTIF